MPPKRRVRMAASAAPAGALEPVLHRLGQQTKGVPCFGCMLRPGRHRELNADRGFMIGAVCPIIEIIETYLQ